MKRRASQFMKTKRFPQGSALVLGTLLLALALRLYGLRAESLWMDEAFSLKLARMDLPTLVGWTSQDIHPPLYYILLHYWIALGESEAVLRGLSILAGVLNVGVIYGLGRTMLGRRTGYVAAVLLAVNPFHIWYSQETRMYAWLALLFSSSMLLALRAWRRERSLTWIGYVLVTTACLYTHYYAVFAILLENVLFLYLFLRRDGFSPGLFRWVGAQVAVLVLFLPWLPTFLLPITVGGGGWLSQTGWRPSVAAFMHTGIFYMVGRTRAQYPALIRRAGYLLFASVFCLGLWGTWRGTTEDKDRSREDALYSEREGVLFSLLYLALPLAVSWGISQVSKPMYSSRYMVPFAVPFLLLVAHGVRKVPYVAARIALTAALVLVMALGVWLQVQVTEKPDWRAWASRVVSRAEDQDLVLFVPGWHAGPFDYYAQGAVEIHDDLPLPVERYEEQVLEMTEQAVAEHPRIWLVWETGHYTDPDGLVYHYLSRRCRQVDEMRMPLLGRIALFENAGWEGEPSS